MQLTPVHGDVPTVTANHLVGDPAGPLVMVTGQQESKLPGATMSPNSQPRLS